MLNNGTLEGMSCAKIDGKICDNCLAATRGMGAGKRRLEEDEEDVH